MSKPPSLLVVSDTTEGGAATSCRRLVQALRRHGEGSPRWVAGKGSAARGAEIAAEWPALGPTAVYRLLARLGTASVLAARAEQAAAERSLLGRIRCARADVLNLHNIHDGVGFGLFERLPRELPVVWTLHDMWPLTGWCAYALDCERYAGSGCVGCPRAAAARDLGQDPAREQARRTRAFERRRARTLFVTPSRWLAACARRRLPAGSRVEVVPYSLDLEVFAPLPDRAAVRSALGLPAGRRILLAGAQDLADTRKGVRLLLAALERLPDSVRRGLLVVLFGERGGGLRWPEGVTCCGPVTDERLLNLYYNAADAYVLPTLADNLPNTLIESLASGTPGVCFAVGGCPEIVTSGETGLLVEDVTPEGLAPALERVAAWSDAERAAYGRRCRAFAEANYAHALQAGRYGALFARILEEPAAR